MGKNYMRKNRLACFHIASSGGKVKWRDVIANFQQSQLRFDFKQLAESLVPSQKCCCAGIDRRAARNEALGQIALALDHGKVKHAYTMQRPAPCDIRAAVNQEFDDFGSAAFNRL